MRHKTCIYIPNKVYTIFNKSKKLVHFFPGKRLYSWLKLKYYTPMYVHDIFFIKVHFLILMNFELYGRKQKF